MNAKAPAGVRRTAAEAHGMTPTMLNHAAYVTRDAAVTADFYTRILGMELASTVMDDAVPSTGDPFPYFHIFFRMRDGSTLAFFECPGLPDPAPSSHPAYDVFNHIALQVDGRAEVERWHAWLVENGVDVIGPIDHKGLILSIYFHDPDGHRLELTTPLDPQWNRHVEQAAADMQLWTATKARALAEGRDVATAMIEAIRDVRRRYGDATNDG